MLGGYFVAKAQFPNMLSALAYVPLVLWLAGRLAARPDTSSLMLLGLAVGMQLLAAHTQISVYTLYFALAYGLWQYACLKSRPAFGRVVLHGLGSGLLAVAFACCYWLPTAELVRSAARQALTLHDANRFHLLPYQLTNFLLPHRHGSPMRGDWRAAGNYWETACYIGIVPAALALAAVIGALRRSPESARVERFWTIVFLLSVWLALGRWAGLYSVAFRIVPGLKAFHDPGRFLLGAAVGAGILAASGAQSLMAYVTKPKLRLAAGFLLLIASVADLGWQARGIYPLKPIPAVAAMSSAPVPIQVAALDRDAYGQGRILMPDSPRSWHEFTTYRRYSQNDPEFLTHWADTLSPCLGMRFDIREMGGYDPETRRDSQDFITRADGYVGFDSVAYGQPKPVVPAGYAAFLGMLSVHDLVAFRVKPLNVPGLRLIRSGGWTRDRKRVFVYANDAYRPRARCFTNWVSVNSQKSALSTLDQEMALSARPGFVDTALLEAPTGVPADLPRPGESGVAAYPLTILRDDADDVAVRSLRERARASSFSPILSIPAGRRRWMEGKHRCCAPMSRSARCSSMIGRRARIESRSSIIPSIFCSVSTFLWRRSASSALMARSAAPKQSTAPLFRSKRRLIRRNIM